MQQVLFVSASKSFGGKVECTYAGQNGAGPAFGAPAAQANGAADGEEQAEPEEAVSTDIIAGKYCMLAHDLHGQHTLLIGQLQVETHSCGISAKTGFASAVNATSKLAGIYSMPKTLLPMQPRVCSSHAIQAQAVHTWLQVVYEKTEGVLESQEVKWAYLKQVSTHCRHAFKVHLPVA